jgi:hypothetical protein
MRRWLGPAERGCLLTESRIHRAHRLPLRGLNQAMVGNAGNMERAIKFLAQ